jgi:hypothetical protein
MLPTFDISQRTITFNPNIRINPIRKLRHNKRNRNIATLGISIKGPRRTCAEFLEESYPTVFQPHRNSHFVNHAETPIL